MGFSEDAIRAAEQAEKAAREDAARTEAAAAAQRATLWRNLEAECRKEAANWFREMGVTSSPAIGVIDTFPVTGSWNGVGPIQHYFGISLGWHLDGHEFRADYKTDGPSFKVFVKTRPTDSGDGFWRNALTKIELGKALLEERQGQRHSA